MGLREREYRTQAMKHQPESESRKGDMIGDELLLIISL
jgi:hypothetical protein